MKLTDKQKEALTALAEVMQEHDIDFDINTSLYGSVDIELWVGVDKCISIGSPSIIDKDTITKLLQEQE